jgi:hypothetical protein
VPRRQTKVAKRLAGEFEVARRDEQVDIDRDTRRAWPVARRQRRPLEGDAGYTGGGQPRHTRRGRVLDSGRLHESYTLTRNERGMRRAVAHGKVLEARAHEQIGELIVERAEAGLTPGDNSAQPREEPSFGGRDRRRPPFAGGAGRSNRLAVAGSG